MLRGLDAPTAWQVAYCRNFSQALSIEVVEILAPFNRKRRVVSRGVSIKLLADAVWSFHYLHYSAPQPAAILFFDAILRATLAQ